MSNSGENVTAKLASLLEAANTADAVGDGELGRCDFLDPDGNPQCANLTQFQCGRVGGNWDPTQTC
jgi:hypothetical protein